MSTSHRAEKELRKAGRSAVKAKKEAGKAVAGVAAAGREAAHEVRDKMAEGVERVGTAVQEAKDGVRQTYDEATQRVGQSLEAARKSMSSLQQDVRTYARDNPGSIMLMAGALGFLLGWWTSRRSGQSDVSRSEDSASSS